MLVCFRFVDDFRNRINVKIHGAVSHDVKTVCKSSKKSFLLLGFEFSAILLFLLLNQVTFARELIRPLVQMLKVNFDCSFPIFFFIRISLK